MQIIVNRDGQQYGPYPLEEVVGHLASGALLPTDWAFTEGMTDWAPLADVMASLQAPAPAPAPQPAPVVPQPAAAQPVVAQPMAAQPVGAQPLADPTQLSAGGGAAVAAQPKQEKKEAKAKVKKSGGGAAAGIQKLLAGKGKFIVLGVLAVGAVGVGVTMFMGDGEAVDIEVQEVNEPIVSSARQELQKLGARMDFDVNSQVNSIEISGVQFTSQHMGWVLELKALTRVSLVKCGINDAALAQLKGLERLSFLDVTGNKEITDAGVEHFSDMKALGALTAVETGITEAGVEKLKEALPNCMVTLKPPEGGAGGIPGGGNPGGNPSTGF